MKEADLTKAERYALLLYRQGKPKSTALPRQCYMDPSQSVMFESERVAKASARARRREG